jgi:hypothetical protein
VGRGIEDIGAGGAKHNGVIRLLSQSGVNTRFRSPVARLHTSDEPINEADLASGERIAADVYVSPIPTEVYRTFVSRDDTPALDRIRYTTLLSVVCATRQSVRPEAYWVNLASRGKTACATFLLNALNPTIGGRGRLGELRNPPREP